MNKIMSILPTGWLKKRMENEVALNVIDKLPKLVPSIFHDDIFYKDRIGPNTKPKDLGTVENDASWNAQLYWWNSETIGNYYDGLMRYGFLLNIPHIINEVASFKEHILDSQDEDGYIGIYTSSLRYRFNSENGELWAKTTIGRFLLGYYRFTEDKKVLDAVVRMTLNVMKNYPVHQSTPFKGLNTSAGVAHGLMFVDVLYGLFDITKDKQYIDYALFLYEDYNRHDVSEKDCLIKNLLDPLYRFKGHGVHTYEHLRVVALYDFYTGKQGKLYHAYVDKLKNVLSPSGGPIGDEWIMGNICDPSAHGYEFCSIHELMNSFVFVSKLGIDDRYRWVKKIYMNASLGAHHQKKQTIAYLKSDNSYNMVGSFQTKQPHSPHNIQTRYKYSPTHQDAAVCCVPNAVRITPYFLDSVTSIQGNKLHIHIIAPVKINLQLDGRLYWLEIQQDSIFEAYNVKTNLPEGSFVIETIPSHVVEVKMDQQGEAYFEMDEIVFAYSIAGDSLAVKEHLFGLEDVFIRPVLDHIPFEYANHSSNNIKRLGTTKIEVNLYQNGVEKKVVLIPMGSTDLRQVTFKIFNSKKYD